MHAIVACQIMGILFALLADRIRSLLLSPILCSTLMCLIDEQGLISAQGGKNQKINKPTGPNHYYTVLPNKSAQGGFFFQKK